MTRKKSKPAPAIGTKTEPERKCAATGQVHPKKNLLRFAVSPDGVLVPDLSETLPGRGIWVSCQKQAIEEALKRKAFSRSAKRQVTIPEALAEQIEKALEDRCLNLLGLGKKAGLLKTGFTKVEASLKAGKAAVLIAANDGASDGKEKLQRLAKGLPLIEIFSNAELSRTLGQENAVHVSMAPSGLTEKFLIEVSRLNGYRNPDLVGREPGRSRND
ncbi:RNA-binding protein [Sneathiella limimaris]|uniref:RNA-binding protein n=1 Tax=Sneathiella limimaris TaxID=1964213 RepID=UPI00146F1DC6